jgi:vancomycin resistance protein YoaR
MEDKRRKLQTLRIILIWTNVMVGVLALACLVAAGSLMAYGRLYENRIFPGVRVLGVRLDGLTKSEARQAVQKSIDETLAKGLKFAFHGREVTLDATVVSDDPDASHDLVRYDVDRALDIAYGLGRDDGWLQNIQQQMRLRVYPMNILARVTVDRSAVADALQSNLKSDLRQVKDASLVITAATGTRPAVSIEPEHSGQVLITDSALDELERQAKTLDFKVIALSERTVKPTITAAYLEPLIPKVFDFLNRPQLVFTYEKDRFPIPTSTLAGWIGVAGKQGSLDLTLDPKKFADGIRAAAPGIEKEGKKGSLVVKDGKIQSFTAGTVGVAIDTDAMLKQVLAEWPATSTFPLQIKTTSATLAGEDPQTMGIKELLGTGYSNFSGSPTNRRKNIARAIEILDGTIIEPGAVFSTVETMGEIDSKHGWFPEMVIKGNETKPEFGGGLCQIGTTLFRGAMKSGLPILERQPHSYRVRYYDPPGTDATIYGPHPDLKFKNDTGNPILIHAYKKGDELFFEFWGTADGRQADYSYPRTWNPVPPEPPKLIETLDLPPGKKKCSEIAHTGLDAEFTYTVKMPDGTVRTQVFRSHYRPWRAVCLIGVEKLSNPPPADIDKKAE